MIRRMSLLMVIAGCFMACSEPASNPDKPNIIFILADDLSYRDLSCYGQEQYQTPNLDMLAESGVRFSQAYVAARNVHPHVDAL